MTRARARPAVSRPPAGGRILALVGIVLVALGLRDAATAVSPILVSIERDIPFNDVGVGVLAMLAPFAFAVVGTLTPPLAKRLGIELSTIVSTGLIGAGQIARAYAPDAMWFLVFSFVSLAGTGAANVLLPPLVKKYFPDRIGGVSTAYLFAAVMGSVLAAYLAAPIASTTDWRVSVATWGFIALVAMVPWIVAATTSRRESAIVTAPVTHDPRVTRLVWTSPTSWALLVSFTIATVNCYIMWGWLPMFLQERLGMSEVDTGAMLGLYTAMSIPSSLLGPTLISRANSLVPFVLYGMVVIIAGGLGLWFIPDQVTWLWVALSGMGVIFFSITLVSINLRTSGPVGSVTLSGMTQGVGYLVGALGPLAVGFVHHSLHDWTPMFVMIIGSALVGIFPLIVLRRPVAVDVERVTHD